MLAKGSASKESNQGQAVDWSMQEGQTRAASRGGCLEGEGQAGRASRGGQLVHSWGGPSKSSKQGWLVREWVGPPLSRPLSQLHLPSCVPFISNDQCPSEVGVPAFLLLLCIVDMLSCDLRPSVIEAFATCLPTRLCAHLSPSITTPLRLYLPAWWLRLEGHSAV